MFQLCSRYVLVISCTYVAQALDFYARGAFRVYIVYARGAIRLYFYARGAIRLL